MFKIISRSTDIRWEQPLFPLYTAFCEIISVINFMERSKYNTLFSCGIHMRVLHGVAPSPFSPFFFFNFLLTYSLSITFLHYFVSFFLSFTWFVSICYLTLFCNRNLPLYIIIVWRVSICNLMLP